MKNNSTKEILYPSNYKAQIGSGETKLPALFIVPRKSWNYVQKELEEVFSKIGVCKPTNIFVFSQLRAGKISFDDSYTIYTDSDCMIDKRILTKSDDVCSEEFGAEILLPFFESLFSGVPVNQFLATEKNEENSKLFFELKNEYPKALFFISRNPSEESLWPESLQD